MKVNPEDKDRKQLSEVKLFNLKDQENFLILM